jgi:hypothetical protein
VALIPAYRNDVDLGIVVNYRIHIHSLTFGILATISSNFGLYFTVTTRYRPSGYGIQDFESIRGLRQAPSNSTLRDCN